LATTSNNGKVRARKLTERTVKESWILSFTCKTCRARREDKALPDCTAWPEPPHTSVEAEYRVFAQRAEDLVINDNFEAASAVRL
jgi:hypothetical protein